MIEARRVSLRMPGRASGGRAPRREGRLLLDDASFEVRPGELVALVGPNGAGKSTLLRTLSGEIEPTSGAVFQGGRPLAAWDPTERARLRAVLPQESPLAFPFSCAEVVLLGRSPHAGTRAQARDRDVARLAMAATGTLPFEERDYPTLSGGERQRVQAARAFAQIWDRDPAGPRVLLLDEPTSNLDLAYQHEILALARRTAGDDCAVVCVLHDLNLAAQYAHRIVVLEGGRVRVAGTPSAVLSPAMLDDVFGIDALVVPHPELACPLVVPRGPSSRTRSPIPPTTDPNGRSPRQQGTLP